ncbi:GDP-mannose 4,6-dehydratase [Nocardioides sp. Bht2]|uniref:GDP-mannose 4,6-dehydratase n=1 Tax=Nocardioides sp. Bht2 TaxID=3392297 RepID=UPI0039B38BAB
MKTAIVTGVAGQDGMYLARDLLARGWRVLGTTRPGSGSSARLKPYLDGVELVAADLGDIAVFAELVDRHRPDAVFNLAGFSSVGRSWGDPALVLHTNATVVASMLETLLRHRDATGREVRFFQASSAEMFGSEVSGALDEETPHRPRTPYAVAKSAAHQLLISYREKYDLFACNGILFNHESPFRGQQFVAGKIVRAAAEAACGLSPTVTLGDLDVHRDWGAAVDVVEGIRRSLTHDRPMDYVFATGVSHTLRDMIEVAFSSVGIDDPSPYLKLEPQMWSSTQADALLGNASRAQVELGWEAHCGFAELISDMVRVDLERLRTGVEEDEQYLARRTAQVPALKP